MKIFLGISPDRTGLSQTDILKYEYSPSKSSLQNFIISNQRSNL